MALQVHFIEIPARIWETEPGSRPFKELAKDAVGMERRIEKGVNVTEERERYALICNWIEQQALDLLSQGGSQRFHAWGTRGDESRKAEMYLLLTEEIQKFSLSDLDRIARHQSEQAFRVSLRSMVESARNWLRACLERKPARREQAAWRFKSNWNSLMLAIGLPGKPHVYPVSRHRVGKSFFAPGGEVQAQWMLYERLDESLVGAGMLSVAEERATFYRMADRAGSAMIEILTTSD